ncbi:MAG: hypothetical protein HZA48_13105 [Planctomycetes bacterium]|nr:hypothetical protein [Planctomycetota bacterium]
MSYGSGKCGYAKGIAIVFVFLCGIVLLPACGGGGGSSDSGNAQITGGDTAGDTGGTTGWDTSGDTGGDTGGTTGGTQAAFLSGTVTYPSQLSKPFINNAGRKSFKIPVKEDNMTGTANANVHAFYYDSNGNKVETNLETSTDSNGQFVFEADDAAIQLLADKLVSVDASFPSLTDPSQYVTIRQVIDMSGYEYGVTSVEVNPLTEAILQQIIGLFAQYNITLTPGQLTAFAELIYNIIAAVDAQLTAGGFEMDETNYYSSAVEDGTSEAGDELGYVTGVNAMIIQYETTELLSQAPAGKKTSKMIEFLCMLGFNVSDNAGKVYMMLEPELFDCTYISGYEPGGGDYDWGVITVDYTNLPGFSAAVYGSDKLAKGIYLIEPSLIYADTMKWELDASGNMVRVSGSDGQIDDNILGEVDANGDGLQNDIVYFDMMQKRRLYEKLAAMPPLSMEFVAEMTDKLSSTVTVSEISGIIAENFQWMKYDLKSQTAVSNDLASYQFYVNSYWLSKTEVLKNSSGNAVPVNADEITGFFLSLNDESTGKLPVSRPDFIGKTLMSEGVILKLFPEALDDAIEKVWEMDSNEDLYASGYVDAWSEIAVKIDDIDTIKTFVSDKDVFGSFDVNGKVYTSGREPIWELERDGMKSLVFAAMPQEMFGGELAMDTPVSLSTAILFIKLAMDRFCRIDPNDEWIRTVEIGIFADTWVDVNWPNIKWLETKNSIGNPVESMFSGLVPGFAPADDKWADAELTAAIDSYDAIYYLRPEWTEPETDINGDANISTWTDTDGDYENDVSVNITAQIIEVGLSGLPAAAGGITVELYTIDWSNFPGGLGELLGSTMTSSYGVFSFNGLELYTDYVALFSSEGMEQWYWIYTDPWLNYVTVQDDPALPGQDIDLDGDGLYDTFTIHAGMWEGDPLPGSETADAWQRSFPYTVYTAEYYAYYYTQYFNPANAFLVDYFGDSLYTDSVSADFSEGVDSQFYVDLSIPGSATVDMTFAGWNPDGTRADKIEFRQGVNVYDIDENALGVYSIEDIYNAGLDYTALKTNPFATDGGSVVMPVYSSFDSFGNYSPQIFLIETGDSSEGITYAYLMQVGDVYELQWQDSFQTTISSVNLGITYAMVNTATGAVEYPKNIDAIANGVSALEIFPLIDGSVYTYDAATVTVALTTVPVLGMPAYAFNDGETVNYCNTDFEGNILLLAREQKSPYSLKLLYTIDYTNLLPQPGAVMIPAFVYTGWYEWLACSVEEYDETLMKIDSFDATITVNINNYYDWKLYPDAVEGRYEGNAAVLDGCFSLWMELFAYPTDGYTNPPANAYDKWTEYVFAPGWGTVDYRNLDFISSVSSEGYLLDAVMPGNPASPFVLNDQASTIMDFSSKWDLAEVNYLYYFDENYQQWTNMINVTGQVSFSIQAGAGITAIDVSGITFYDIFNSWALETRTISLTNTGGGWFEGAYTFQAGEYPSFWLYGDITGYDSAGGVEDSIYYSVENPALYNTFYNAYPDIANQKCVYYSTDANLMFSEVYNASAWRLSIADAAANVVFDTGVLAGDTTQYLYEDPVYGLINGLSADFLSAGQVYALTLEVWYADGSTYVKTLDLNVQ